MCQDVYVFLKHTKYKDNQHHKSVERMPRHLRNRHWHPVLEPDYAEQFCGIDTRYWGPTSSPAPRTKLGAKPICSEEIADMLLKQHSKKLLIISIQEGKAECITSVSNSTVRIVAAGNSHGILFPSTGWQYSFPTYFSLTCSTLMQLPTRVFRLAN